MSFKVHAIDFNLKMSNAVVTLTEVKLTWLMYVGFFYNRCILNQDKNLPNL